MTLPGGLNNMIMHMAQQISERCRSAQDFVELWNSNRAQLQERVARVL